jgi:6-pyruvoyltetrahydropterin/6-carboxytetrahydropterin synthase
VYQIAVEQEFDAAHALREYHGRCEALHGHTFKAVATVKAGKLNDIGLAYDFTDLKRALNEVISRFDHANLTEVPPFDKINPSSENLARTIFEGLKARLAGEPVTLTTVEVWESPRTHVIYAPD